MNDGWTPATASFYVFQALMHAGDGQMVTWRLTNRPPASGEGLLEDGDVDNGTNR